MLLYEGLLRPASDLSTLAFHLQAVAIMHNISFAELIFEVLRCLLLTISQKEGFESLKVDSFILVIDKDVLLHRLGHIFVYQIHVHSDPVIRTVRLTGSCALRSR